MRRPSLQFYPGDWQSNPKLRRCSHAEKGIWLDVLCILHDQDEYGIIRWPLRDLAIAVHAKLAALQSLVDKGVMKGADVSATCDPFIYVPRHGGKDGHPVTLIESQEGPLWFSSRMVRDEHIRLARAANEPKPKDAPKVKPKRGMGETIGTGLGQPSKPDPSRAGASSSSSSSISNSEKKEKEPSAFAEFMKFLSHKIGPIPNPGKEGKAIKWLVENGYDFALCQKCFEFLESEGWRTSSITWTTVKAEIGGWLAKGRTNGNGNRPQQRETSSQRDLRNLKETLKQHGGTTESDSEIDSEVAPRLLTSDVGTRTGRPSN